MSIAMIFRFQSVRSAISRTFGIGVYLLAEKFGRAAWLWLVRHRVPGVLRSELSQGCQSVTWRA
jgi:hypothetical protein